MDFDGLGSGLNFDRWCCLCAEFYSLDGTSIMESVVLRSWALLHSPLVLGPFVNSKVNSPTVKNDNW